MRMGWVAGKGGVLRLMCCGPTSSGVFYETRR